jgi:8-amino-7-oxononanoate synthase
LHNNTRSLATKITRQTGVGLIATDNIFSMDGDAANIDQLQSIAKQNSAYLYQDDAHGFGIFTPNIPANSIYMATFGKAVGTMGAFVAGDEELIELLIQQARPYIYTTAIAPALAVATLKSLDIIQTGAKQALLFANIQYFQQLCAELELPVLPSNSAIQPLMIAGNQRVLALEQFLISQGFSVKAIRAPTVAKNSERLRITLNAKHTKNQIQQLLITIKNAL